MILTKYMIDILFVGGYACFYFSYFLRHRLFVLPVTPSIICSIVSKGLLYGGYNLLVLH